MIGKLRGCWDWDEIDYFLVKKKKQTTLLLNFPKLRSNLCNISMKWSTLLKQDFKAFYQIEREFLLN